MESLASMIKDTDTEVNVTPTTLDIPDQSVEQNDNDGTEVINANEQATETSDHEISTTDLSTWFQENHNNFDRVNRVNIQIRGIIANEDLVFSVLDPNGGEDDRGNPKRKLKVWNDAHKFQVLNLDGTDMNVFSNGLVLIHQINDITIKCYGSRSGLHAVFCLTVGENVVPYAYSKMKRKDTSLAIPTPPDRNSIEAIFEAPLNKEDIQILYPQCTKHIDDMETFTDLYNWFIDRQKGIYDINHLLQIDNVIINSIS